MGPPVIHGTPVVPKMGVRVRMYDRSHRREIWNAQPSQMSDGLMPGFLNSESLDLQPGPETRVPLCDLWSPSTRRASVRMKRSNSEQMMSNYGDEDLDSAPENPNTGSSLRREYGSTSTLDRQTFKATRTPSSSLQAAAQIAQGNVNFILGHGNLSDSVCSTDKENFQNMKLERSDEARFSSNKCFSHYDVQSILFNIRDPSSTRADLNVWFNPAAVIDDKDCSFYCDETGEETERTLDQTCSNVLLSTCSTNAAVSVLEFCRGTQVFPQNEMNNYDFEHIDLGAKYYLQFFYNRDHQNYFGIDKNFGPVSLSVRREKLEDGKEKTQYNYRIILRTTQLPTLRGSILEDSVPSSSKHRASRGLPLRDVLEFVVPDLNIQDLRLATDSPRVPEMLLQLDQQVMSFQRKVDVLFHRPGWTTGEDNREPSSPALDQFLDLLGNKLRHAGSHSVSTTFREFELMFQVSTLQPNNSQQLLHKLHIPNNNITVIFQEPDSPPFIPKNTRSHSQHVFIIIRVQQPCSQHTWYSVSVSRHRDVPPFGPVIPLGLKFPASPVFREFLLTKIINAEHAVRRSETFVAMATRRRREHLRELVENFITSTPVDSSSSPRFSFIHLGRKKKVHSPLQPRAHLLSTGALTWRVTAPDLTCSASACCRLAISSELVVLIEEASRRVVFNCCCRDVIGWSGVPGGIKLFYLDGHYLVFSTQEGNWEDGGEIAQRLQLVTRGSPALNMTLRRNHLGQLGFLVSVEGVVGDVETLSPAWQAGLRPGCRLMEICRVAMVTLTHKQMMELLRTSETVDLLVLLPHRDGTPRRSCSKTCRVPTFVSKLSDVMTPPSWHQVSEAPPPSRAPSNQNQTFERLQQLSSTFDMKEGSRALSDWPIVSDVSTESESPQDRTWTTSEVSRHPHPVMKVKEFQQRLTEKSSNTSSREDRHYVSMDANRVSMDSGIDSSAPSAPPSDAATTLVLRDIWRETTTSGITVAMPAGHVTNLSASDLRLSCCEKSISVFTPSPWRPPTRTLSHDSLYWTLSPSRCRRLVLMSDQLLTRRVSSKLHRSELYYSDSSLAEGSTMASSHLDRGQPVDAARVFEEVSPLHRPLEGTPALQDRDVTDDTSLSGKVFQLEKILHRLQLNLLKEKQDKAALQEQVLSLRQDNLHLKEAGRSAAEQTRRFAARRLHRETAAAAATATRKSSV